VAIAQAASFNPELAYEVWNAGQDWPYCFAPDVNLGRDPATAAGRSRRPLRWMNRMN
jgi:hypothetical protein